MDRKRFIINLVSNALNALTGVAITFFLTPYIVELLGVEAYGFFPLTNNFIVWIGIFTSALNSMSGRYITISLEHRDICQLNIYFNSVLFGNIVLSGLFLLVGGLAICYLTWLMDIPSHLFHDVKLLFALVLGSLCINVSSAVFSVSSFALTRFDKQAMISIGVNIIRLGTLLLLFWLLAPRIYFLGIAAVLSSIFYAVQNFRYSKRLIPEIILDSRFFSWGALSALLSSGVWNSLTSLSNVINTQLDLLIANNFFGSKDMGILSLTKVGPNLLQMLLGIIVPIFLPDLIKLYARGDIEILKKELDFSFLSIFTIALLPISIFFIYGQEFFELWVPTQPARKLYILSTITLIPFLIHATIETIHNVFVITDKLKIAALWGILVAICNLTLTLTLCRLTDLGLFAIPISALVTGCLSHLTFTPLYAAKCLNVSRSYFYKRILKGFGSFSMLLILLSIWKYLDLIPADTWLLLLVNCFFISLFAMVILFYVHLDRHGRKLIMKMILKKI